MQLEKHRRKRHLDVIVFRGHGRVLGQTFTEPHGNVSLHVDGKGFKTLLQATDRKKAQTADILAKINPPNLRQAQRTNWDKT